MSLMDDGNPLSLAFILIPLCACAWFAAAEGAFASASRSRIRARAEHGSARASRALRLLENHDGAMAAAGLCLDISRLAALCLAARLSAELWGPAAAVLGGVVLALLLFITEALVKSAAEKNSERCALACAGSLCFFMLIFRPFTHMLAALGSASARGGRAGSRVTVTEDELYDIIETMKDEGELGEERSGLVHSALMFADVTVSSVLTARVDLDAVDIEDSDEEILGLIKSVRHSRLPVYRDSVDNIIGVLQVRKYIKARLKNDGPVPIEPLLDEAYFVDESTNIDELLPEMSRKKLNLAIVTDSHGGTLGVVTIEDILEELVGEIWDEDDEVVEVFTKHPDGSVELDAELDIEDALDIIGYDDPEDTDWEHKLLGEWAYEHFDMLPREGDTFRYNGLEFTISGMRQNRITRLTARLLPGDAPEAAHTEGGGAE